MRLVRYNQRIKRRRVGEIGRHASLRSWWPQGCVGSSPAPGTTERKTLKPRGCFSPWFQFAAILPHESYDAAASAALRAAESLSAARFCMPGVTWL